MNIKIIFIKIFIVIIVIFLYVDIFSMQNNIKEFAYCEIFKNNILNYVFANKSLEEFFNNLNYIDQLSMVNKKFRIFIFGDIFSIKDNSYLEGYIKKNLNFYKSYKNYRFKRVFIEDILKYIIKIKNKTIIIKIIKLLKDLDINLDYNLYTAIHQDDIVLFKALALACDINIKNTNNDNLLSYVIVIGKYHFVKILVDAKIDINNCDDEGYNCLMLAILTGKVDFDVLQYLIDKGINIEQKTNYGITALMLAVFFNDYKAVKFLVENNANINAEDIFGKTALYRAKKYKRKKILAYLQSKINNQEISLDNDMKKCNLI